MTDTAFGGQRIVEHRQEVVGGPHLVAARAEAFGIGHEVGVGEIGGHVVPDLEVHLPLDQPVGVVLPDQHGQRDALAYRGLDLL